MSRRPRSTDRPAAGRSRSRGADTKPAADPDGELFLKALEELDAVPDKDAATPPSPRRKPQRRKAPKKLPRPPDAVLDLHGKTVEEARSALQTFILKASREGRRLLLVITGKGHGSSRGRGILRQELQRWIRQEGSPHVAAYSEAPRALGGSGAFLLYPR